jgi:predicted AlkP superfamily phosphohydrolase/phosphomutase
MKKYKAKLSKINIIFLLIVITLLIFYYGNFHENSIKKVIIIGVDGGDWNVINKLIEQGKLPNLEKLMKEGSWGNLTSTEPPVSPISWTSIATGKKSEKHGITGFSFRSPGMYEPLMMNSYFLKSKTLWEILNENTKTTNILCWFYCPLPEKMKGFLVPGALCPNYGEKGQKTYPPNIVEEIEYLELPNITTSQDHMIEIAENNVNTIKKNAIHLMKEYNYDFFALVFDDTDFIQHYFWKYWEPEKFKDVSQEDIKKYGEFIPRVYEAVDNSIGQIINNIDENTIIILVSDHGFQAQEWKYFYNDFNILLEELDLLKFTNITNKNNIDWLQTKAYYCEEDIVLRGSGQGICINLKQRESNGIINQGKESEDLKEEIIKLLSNITILETKEHLFSNIYKQENKNSSIDIEFQINDNISNLDYPQNLSVILPNNKIIQMKEFMYDSNLSGTHEKNGIFLARGKYIKDNTVIKNATVYDITPTILYIYDVPIPKDIDGRVLTEIFDKNYLKKHPIKYTEESSQISSMIEQKKTNKTLEEEMIERLKELGYIK